MPKGFEVESSDLTGSELDLAVAKAEGFRIEGEWVRCPNDAFIRGRSWEPMRYSSDWSRGGPIIERERIEIGFMGAGHGWQAAMNPEACSAWQLSWHDGPTPLIAAMRAYVASKHPASS